MSAINTSQLWAPVEPVTRKAFGLGAKSIKKVFPRIFDVAKGQEAVRHAYELGGPGQLVRKTEGANISALTIRQGAVKTWLYEVYAGRIELTWELARDCKVREIKKAASTLGRSLELTKEYVAALFLDRAFNSSYPATPDGKELCATDHTIVGTQTSDGSNELSTPAALSETSLEDVYTALMSFKAADGMIASVMPKKLIVPAALGHTAKKLNRAGNQLGSANNDPKVVGDDLEVVVNPYLSSTTRWFVKTDWSEGGLFFESDVDGEFMEDNVMTNLNKAYIAISRYRVGCDDWRDIFGVAAS